MGLADRVDVMPPPPLQVAKSGKILAARMNSGIQDEVFDANIFIPLEPAVEEDVAVCALLHT